MELQGMCEGRDTTAAPRKMRAVYKKKQEDYPCYQMQCPLQWSLAASLPTNTTIVRLQYARKPFWLDSLKIPIFCESIGSSHTTLSASNMGRHQDIMRLRPTTPAISWSEYGWVKPSSKTKKTF